MSEDAEARATVAKIEDALKALREDNRVARRQLDGAPPAKRSRPRKPEPAPEPAAPPETEEEVPPASEESAAAPDAAPEAGPAIDAGEGRGALEETQRAHLRMVEALLFAASEPLDTETIRARLPEGADVGALLALLQSDYEDRGVVLARVAGKWRLQTAPDLAHILRQERPEPRKLSQAARETLAIIAYHQPVTRAEIEGVRGVAVSKGTLDVLLELGWVRPRGRRRSPGRPTVYATTESFLQQFGLESLEDLPGKEDLKAAGLLDEAAPDDFEIPDPAAIAVQEELALLEPGEEGVDAAFHTDYLSETEDET